MGRQDCCVLSLNSLQILYNAPIFVEGPAHDLHQKSRWPEVEQRQILITATDSARLSIDMSQPNAQALYCL